MKLKELREALAAKHKSMRELHDKAEGENRGFNTDEKAQWDSYARETTALEERISTAETIERAIPEGVSDEVREQQDRARFEERRKGSTLPDPDEPLNEYQRARAFTAWGLGIQNKDRVGAELCARMGIPFASRTIEINFDRGVDANGIPLRAPQSFREVKHQVEQRSARRAEQRAANKVNQTTGGLKAADGSLGGYTVPDEMQRSMDVALLQWGGMRQVATVLSTNSGADLPIPTNNDTANKGEIIAENTAVNEQEVTFAQLVLGSYKYSSKIVKCSVELLQDSAVNLPAFLGDALGTRIGRITNDHFTTGTGTSQPNGVVTAAANSGVTAATAGKLAYGEVLQLKHSVDPAYRENARFMMADAILRRMKEMADSQGRPIWLPSLIPGEPPTFDGDPYTINQSMPTAATNKGLLYGDFSKYIIREVRGITLMRLDERFAELHQVGFLAFVRMDGDLLNAGTNPVKYLTLA